MEIFLTLYFLIWGALIIKAEIIPLKPDPDNAGVGNREYPEFQHRTEPHFR